MAILPAAAAAVPIVLATGIIRLVAPKVASKLIQSGAAKKATQKMIDSMKGYIPKATKKEAESLAKKPAGRASPTSAPLPKSTPTGSGTRLTSRARLKRERDKEKKEEAARKEKEDKINQRKIIENLNKRNLPANINKPLATTGGRSVTTTGGRSVTTTGEKVVGLSKKGAGAANRASQVGTSGTENTDSKPEPKTEINSLRKIQELYLKP